VPRLACLLLAPLLAPQDRLQVPEGFVVERLHTLGPGEEPYLALTSGGSACVAASAHALWRIELDLAPDRPSARVERLDLPLAGVTGLCFDPRGEISTVYAVQNDPDGATSAFLRLTDTDGDERLDRVERLRTFEGGGPQGLHAVVLGPEEALYLVGGPGVFPPPEAVLAWGRSFLPVGRLPVATQTVDLEGVAPRRFPSGWVARTDREGARWDLVAVGLAEARDLAFRGPGKPVLVDADPLDERGLPWALPARLLPLAERADFGFRPGAARWPEWFPDGIQGTPLDLLAPGALVATEDLDFPEAYREGVLAADPLGGRVLALVPEGAGWRVEELLRGRPLAVRGLAAGPGRSLLLSTDGDDAGLLRVRWTGAPAAGHGGSYAPLGEAFGELCARVQEDPAEAVPWLEDEGLPFHPGQTARMALETVPFARWSALLTEVEPRTRAVLELACARVARPKHVAELLARLAAEPLVPASAPEGDARALALSRARTLELALLRAPPPPEVRARLAETLLAAFPSGAAALDAQLGVLLASLPEAAARFVPLAAERCARGTDPAEAFRWAFLARQSSEGWTSRTRRHVFNWLYGAQLGSGGGRAVPLYLAALRDDLAAGLDPEARTDLGPLAEPPPELGATYASARRSVRAWTLEELLPAAGELEAGRDLERGRALLAEARCLACHRVEGQGGSRGPELVGLGARATPRGLLARLLHPPDGGSELWRDTVLTTRDGRRHVGRVVGRDEGGVRLRERYGIRAVVRYDAEDLAEEARAPLSPMPAGLLDGLTREEVLDLVAFLRTL